MLPSSLTISHQAQRRFILGKQGLFPGRRWRGKAGVTQAMREGVVVQFDPLNIIARSHDLVLHSRVLDYSPELLNQLLYQDRAFFDYGGVVRIQPMSALPHWRVVMARVAEHRGYLGEQNQSAVVEVLAALRERGPLSNRDFASVPGQRQYWHASKSTAQALYFLWLSGRVMTHSRKGVERRFDLAERIVPPAYDRVSSMDEAEDYFALRVLQEWGLADLRDWRSQFISAIERKVSMSEAADRLNALVESGQVARVTVEGAARDAQRYLLSPDLPLLEELHAGRIPVEWQPLKTITTQEATFLAPLDIVSARGRALPVFGFDYVWEVYKPVEQRRWGYYVLPILYGDRLVGRFDSALDRSSRVLTIKGFWLEDGVCLDDALCQAISAAFHRFAPFVGFERLENEIGLEVNY